MREPSPVSTCIDLPTWAKSWVVDYKQTPIFRTEHLPKKVRRIFHQMRYANKVCHQSYWTYLDSYQIHKLKMHKAQLTLTCNSKADLYFWKVYRLIWNLGLPKCCYRVLHFRVKKCSNLFCPYLNGTSPTMAAFSVGKSQKVAKADLHTANSTEHRKALSKLSLPTVHATS